MSWELAASGHPGTFTVSAGTLAAGGLQLSARTWALVLLAALIVAGLYLAGCLVWPYGPCLACRAHRGRNRGSTSKRHGRCRVCRGTGERLRIGTRCLLAWTADRYPKGVRK